MTIDIRQTIEALSHWGTTRMEWHPDYFGRSHLVPVPDLKKGEFAAGQQCQTYLNVGQLLKLDVALQRQRKRRAAARLEVRAGDDS